MTFTLLLAGFLYNVPAIDPITFALVPILLLVATLAACLIPACRAAAVDPMNALRHEGFSRLLAFLSVIPAGNLLFLLKDQKQIPCGNDRKKSQDRNQRLLPFYEYGQSSRFVPAYFALPVI